MIVYLRTARTIRGKRGEAKKWAIEITDYINTLDPDIQCRIFIPRFGEMNRIFWQTEFDDLMALDSWQKKLAMDEGYRKFSIYAQDLFSQDSIEDMVLVTLK